jgi:hypothetical protein
VEWRTKEKAKGVVTVVELCLSLESKVGAAYLFRLPFFFPVSPLEINGTCRKCSKGATRGVL